MISEETLRNFYKKEIRQFLKNKNIERLERLNPKGVTQKLGDYSNYVAVIKEEVRSGRLTKKSLDDFLYSNLFHSKNNLHYIFELEDFIIKQGVPFDRFSDFVSKNPGLLVNEYLFDKAISTDWELCQTRFNFNSDNSIATIEFLIKVLPVKTARGTTHLFAAVTVNLTEKLISIKYNQTVLECSAHSKTWLTSTLKNTLVSRAPFTSLKMLIKGINEYHGKKTIFKMFNNLSQEAEKILNSHVKDDTKQKIIQFLEEMGINPERDEYVKQIISVVYQDLSESFDNNTFKDGWVFRFVFREGEFTRASSRSDNFDPIYNSQVYWNLKELIYKKAELIEAGFNWFIKINNETFTLFTRIEIKGDAFIVYYYNKGRYKLKRKEKENYVFKQIRGNL